MKHILIVGQQEKPRHVIETNAQQDKPLAMEYKNVLLAFFYNDGCVMIVYTITSNDATRVTRVLVYVNTINCTTNIRHNND